MAGEYNINLSNGTVLATLYPLESNGPDNRSTPRLIKRSKPTFEIVQIGALSPNGVIKVGGDVTSYFPVGLTFSISGSTGNDGTYTVANLPIPGATGSPIPNGAWYDSSQDETNIIVTTTLASSTADGNVEIDAFVLSGDLTYRFVAGFQFDVQGSAGGFNDGTYTTSAFGSFNAGLETIIPVVGTVTSTSPPLGEIVYTILDARSPLVLPGKGTLNYGEFLVENMVRITENFAATNPPDANTNLGTTPPAQSLVGQLWYNTTPGQEGMKVYDGSSWTSNQDVDDGALILRDPENSDTDIYITAAEANLPGSPWAGTPEPGLVVWTETDPANDQPIFRVLSADGAERLRVEHHATANSGYIRTINNIDIQATGDSYIQGQLGVGTNAVTAGVTLDVVGNTQVTGNAEVVAGNLIVDTDTLYVDYTNDRVGINITPSYPLDVLGDTRVDGRVGINQVPPVTNVPAGTDIYLAVTGDIQANSQFLADDGALGAPSYAFTTATNTGTYLNGSDVAFVVAGTSVLNLTSSSVQPTTQLRSSLVGSTTNPNYSFTADTSTGMWLDAVPNDIVFSIGGSELFRIEADGTLSVSGGSPGYETLVTDDNDIPNKRYVDDTTVNVTGDTMTGNLVMASGATITGVPDPSNDQDVANKQYVDSVAEGLQIKASVRAATTSDLGGTYDNGGSPGGIGATITIPAGGSPYTLDIDGVTSWNLFDGVLVKDQTNAAENGRYYVSQIGGVGSPIQDWILTRCETCDEPTEVPGAFVFVQDGTTNKGTGWAALVEDTASPPGIQIGVDDITWVQFSGAGSYAAGDGLNLVGTTFSVDGTVVRTTRTITAGNGLTGGGDLTADRTLTLGTPGTVTGASTNSVTATTHTHALTLVSGDVTGALGFTPPPNTRTITAGNGLTGGGDLTADRTLTLGTPGTITGTSTNTVTATSHTHEITDASTAQAGIVQLNDTLTSTSTTLALTAAQGKVLQDTKAPLVSPTFTGTPSAPTATAGTNSTQIATTAFVQTAVASNAGLPDYEIQTGTGAATYTLGFTISANSAPALQVFVNGVKQVYGGTKAYTITLPNQVVFNVGSEPTSGDDVEFYGYG